ncbi:AMP-binding protein [Aquincola sp. S2]|uniref:AMP-binding protein n=1 Tax=Pseudaquabacterium terrae TaxID=2732868 RepID=A0ABX2ESW7_9BURK|nr:AMP-binding protein [Aquabacterium terrae]NRF71639.1 AMP-binding protein [Aquabacterium terrae]
MARDFSTLPQLWRKRCAEQGDRAAMRYKQRGIWSTVSWRQFFEDARAIAMAMSAAGVGPGDVVAVLAENRPEWLVVELAAQALGGIVHGIEPHATAAEAGLALQRSAARIVFVDTVEQLAKVRSSDAADLQLRQVVAFESHGLHAAEHDRIVRYDDWLASGTRLAREHPRLFDERIDQGRDDAIALFAPGAGTAVPVTQGELLVRLWSALEWMKLDSGDHVLSFEPLMQVGERVAVLAAMLALGVLVHFPESSSTVFNDLAEAAPHMVRAPARFWARLHDRVEQAMNDAPPRARRSYARALAATRRGWWRRALLRRVSRSLGLQRMRMAIVVPGDVESHVAAWYRALDIPLLSRPAA